MDIMDFLLGLSFGVVYSLVNHRKIVKGGKRDYTIVNERIKKEAKERHTDTFIGRNLREKELRPIINMLRPYDTWMSFIETRERVRLNIQALENIINTPSFISEKRLNDMSDSRFWQWRLTNVLSLSILKYYTRDSFEEAKRVELLDRAFVEPRIKSNVQISGHGPRHLLEGDQTEPEEDEEEEFPKFDKKEQTQELDRKHGLKAQWIR